MHMPQLFFIHIPKCAGTSVIDSLSRIGARRFLILSESPESKLHAQQDMLAALRKRNQQIEDIDLIVGHDVHFGLESLSTRDGFYFTILRSPVERYVSHYRYFVDCAHNLKNPIHDLAKKKVIVAGQLLTLSQCVDQKFWPNVMTNYLAAANDPNPHTKRWEITDPNELLRLALESINRMSHIGFVSSLGTDLALLSSMLGIKNKLKAVNKSKSEMSRSLPEQLVSKIRDLNSLDLQLFDDAKARRQAISGPETARD